MITALTVGYLLCFQLCAWPAIIRIYRRGSSADLSVWREALLIAGVTLQFVVMWHTGASWHVLISPICSGLNVLVLTAVIVRYRR